MKSFLLVHCIAISTSTLVPISTFLVFCLLLTNSVSTDLLYYFLYYFQILNIKSFETRGEILIRILKFRLPKSKDLNRINFVLKLRLSTWFFLKLEGL